MKLEFTKRVRIPTGLDCNERCKFCYYLTRLNTQRYTTEQMLAKLDYAREHGILDVDFSGGEPTLLKDLPLLLGRCRDLGFRRICIITNGSRTADKGYLDTLKSAGLNEVLMSIHGHCAETHNAAVGRAQSWKGVEDTVANCRALGLRLRTNTVVSRLNFADLDKIAAYLRGVAPAAANFICFNDWNNAVTVAKDLSCRYSDAAPGLRAAVELLRPAVSKVTVRYIPFCFMKGYEKHVCGLLQNEFDNDEWVDPVKTVVTFADVRGREAADYYRGLQAALPSFRAQVGKAADGFTEAELASPGLFDGLPARAMNLAYKVDRARMRAGYVKAPGCAGCRWNAICDGLEKSYASFIGTGELTPEPGEPVTDPMHFRGAYAAEWK